MMIAFGDVMTSSFCSCDRVTFRDPELLSLRYEPGSWSICGSLGAWQALAVAAIALKTPRSTTAMLQVSHGDDERPSRVTGRNLTDGLGRLAQRVGAADDRPDLSGLDQFL